MREDLIAELRELCAIEGRPLTVGERARTKIAMSEAAAALEAAREGAERAMDGLRYAALVWVLSDEIEQSPETVDSAVRRMIRGGAEFRRTGHRAFPAIDQARGKGVAE